MPELSIYGYWWAPESPDQRVAGHLTQVPRRAPKLSLLDAPPEMWAPGDGGWAIPLGQQSRIPMLHGRTADMGGGTLLDCTWSGLHVSQTQTTTFVVGHYISGLLLDRPDEACFRRVQVVLPALEGILGTRPLRLKAWPRAQSKNLNWTFNRAKQSWKVGEIEATWEYAPAIGVGRTGGEMEMRPLLTVTSSTPKPYMFWIQDWLYPVNHFLQIATGAQSNPESLTVWLKKNYRTAAEREAEGLTVRSKGIGEHEYDYKEHQVLVRASDVQNHPNGLPGVVRESARLHREQEVFVDALHGVLTNADRPLHNKLLDVVSGLEAYHGRLHGQGPVSETAFKAKKKEALEAVKTTGLPPAHRKFIKRWLPGRSSYSLEERLHGLAEEVGVLERWSMSPQDLAKVRNSVAHGTDVEGAQLREAYEQAVDLARRLVLKELRLG